MSRMGRLALFALCFVAASPWAFAQSSDEMNAGLQLDFSVPGARSLALGGAFIGLADDATAAFSNPAGLTVLSRPELSIEGRRRSYTTEFLDSGHLFGEPTNLGVDDLAGPRRGRSDDDATGVSFLSGVYARPDSRWALAVYAHELANYGASIQTGGAFFGSCGPGEVCSRLFPVRGRLDLSIDSVGVAAGVRLTDSLSFGASVAHYDFELRSLTERFSLAGGEFFGPPDFGGGRINFQSQRGDDSDVGFTAGLLWRSAAGKVGFGAVYRRGPEFEFDARHTAGELFVDPPPGTELNRATGRFKVPDVTGVGLSFRLGEPLLVTLQVDRVQYSQLAEDSIDIFGGADRQAFLRHLEIEDADEVRLGLEWLLPTRNAAVALRAGAWLDPAHRLFYSGPTDAAALGVFGGTIALLADKGDDEIHYTAGFGIAFRRVELNVGADFSELADTVSVSMIARR
jgi:long-chain fatty acid transport protein